MAPKRAPTLSKAEREARREHVIALLGAKKSYKEIHELTGVPKSTIGDIAHMIKERGNADRKPGSGAPKKFPERCVFRNKWLAPCHFT